MPAARRWVNDEREWLARLGSDVLADHLGPEAAGAVADLRRFWLRTPHSYGSGTR